MKQSVFVIRNMDCPTEEALIRKRLGSVHGIGELAFDLIARRLTVTHTLGDEQPILVALHEIGMEAVSAMQASNFATWQLAHAAAQAIRSNAELVGKAYSLGESSRSDSLIARRFSLESSLAENLAQLDANEALYRLLLDAHQLWPLGNSGDEHHTNHY